MVCSYGSSDLDAIVSIMFGVFYSTLICVNSMDPFWRVKKLTSIVIKKMFSYNPSRYEMRWIIFHVEACSS
jgi:hypothetical protein